MSIEPWRGIEIVFASCYDFAKACLQINNFNPQQDRKSFCV
jgi:hypothetical protein